MSVSPRDVVSSAKHPMLAHENFLSQSCRTAANHSASYITVFGCPSHLLMCVTLILLQWFFSINQRRQLRVRKCSGLCHPWGECKCSVGRDGE